MTESSNMATVRRFYANLGSPEVLVEVLSPTIQWEITQDFRTAAFTTESAPSSMTSSAASSETLMTGRPRCRN